MPTKTKTKAAAIKVPQSDDEADALLRAHGEHQRQIARITSDMNTSIAAIKDAFEKDAKPHIEAIESAFAGIQAWAAAHRNRLTRDGKTKTFTMPAGQIGWRIRPPAIAISRKTTVKAVIALMMKRPSLKEFLRCTVTIDKEAMLKKPEKVQTIEGVSVVTGVEDFYVEPVGAELSEPKK